MANSLGKSFVHPLNFLQYFYLINMNFIKKD